MKKVKVLDVLKEIIDNLEKGKEVTKEYYVKNPDDRNFYLVDEIYLLGNRVSYDGGRDYVYFDKDTEIYVLEENDN